MKKHITTLALFSLTFILTFNIGYSQVQLYANGFEGTDEDTYNLTTASGSNVDFVNFTASDYILRGNPAANSSIDVQPTGFSGSNLIMWEDFDGYLADGGQLYLTTNDINISGASGISVQMKIGVTNDVADRYEASDFLTLEYQIDGGLWVTFGDFRGVINGNTFNFYEDDDLNGTYTAQITNAMKQLNYDLDVIFGTQISGSLMKIRIRAFSGVQEEMVIDDLVVEATVLSIDDNQPITNIEVYPNPASEVLRVSNWKEPKEYIIYNQLGTQISKGKNTENKIDIQNLKTGLYFLKFENSDPIKFIKK
ncbi:putative secreted protein (Por secretion system target) [Nonlabens dokdonensis]|uniref:Lysyl endopeptidase n=2 Tax=Nonlabens dokdonensis TaxID=328515 RepID=L7WG26_NONDD|nr:T9SS type A sorting domain-containing protein [Nonlabens dokdonensis]AGC77853.1 lysyl endopeptidase [Nonlabens dokdonensis DSW-6]PZX39617.1 putative secreted protein (Por secretion system target) [Nonlabens dokdonensis]